MSYLLQELEVGLFVKCIVRHVLEEPPGEREVINRLMAGVQGHPMPHIGLEALFPLPNVVSNGKENIMRIKKMLFTKS